MIKRKNFKPIVLAAVLVGFLLTAKGVFAAVRCETQYGGGQVCVKTGQIQIDKKVKNPQNGSFVDNLFLSDYKFAPGEEVTFKLAIKNVGDETFGKVEVKDALPEYFEKTSGDLSFTLDNLTTGKTEEREIKAKVVSLPNDKTTICVVNTAEAWSGDERDKDTAQVCLEKKVLAAAPTTGPENLLFLLAGSLLSALGGLTLVKFSTR